MKKFIYIKYISEEKLRIWILTININNNECYIVCKIQE